MRGLRTLSCFGKSIEWNQTMQHRQNQNLLEEVEQEGEPYILRFYSKLRNRSMG
jgi:hypothetical protein